jgi:hypothetical protein
MLLRKRAFIAAGVGAFTLVAVVPTVSADAPSGAIFTTLNDGSEVNFNQFPSKDAVYLDGGPGPGAPQTAAGLDDGTYVFQVTDPSGKTLLSTDRARCRQFVVEDGVIAAVVDTDCEHLTGSDLDHDATTVQLVPFSNTPNNGGEYKVWATRVEDFLAGCQALGFAGNTGLDVVDCGFKDDVTPPKGLNAHGFTTDSSKTDNFKVKLDDRIREIDSIFYEDENGNGAFDWFKEEQLPELHMFWTDTLGVKNIKHSYFLPNFNITAAHAEAVEKGIHKVTIPDLTTLGCVVGEIYVNDVNHYQPTAGPQEIKVDLSNVKNSDKDVTVQVWVACNS